MAPNTTQTMQIHLQQLLKKSLQMKDTFQQVKQEKP